MSGKILIKNAKSVAILKKNKREIKNAWIEITDNIITDLGDDKTTPANEQYSKIIDAKNKIIIPGLVNTHHHFFQTLTRAYSKTNNAKLFDWLVNLYPIWSQINEEAVYTATKLACAEMMLSGCTMTTDHHYLFPKSETRLIDAQIEAGKDMGIRFHPTRGSMCLSKKDGGLPPDTVVQTENEILKDSERLIDRYHNPEKYSMIRVALAPCSPFSVTQNIMKQTAKMAEDKDVLLHTHLAETMDEEEYCLDKFGLRPLDYLEEVGWLNHRVWLAHGIFFNDGEIKRMGDASIGVAHCPSSNMRLGSGICKVGQLSENGVRVGIAVDGSSSNDSSHMLAEARQAMLLARVAYGADAMSTDTALRLATQGGADILGRDDAGSIEVGKVADLAIFDTTNSLSHSGADDALSSLLLCNPINVDILIINGVIQIDKGEFVNQDIQGLIAQHRKISENFLGKRFA